MTKIQDKVTYFDGSVATGKIVVTWPPFDYGGVAVAAGQQEYPIAPDGSVLIECLPCVGAQPVGTYYTATYELDRGATYDEYWFVPTTPTTTIGAIRVSVPATPSIMINAQQLTGSGAQSGMFLGWNGSNWVPMYPSSFNCAVRSFFGRTGDVMPLTGDYTVDQVTNAVPNTRRVIAGTGLSGGGPLTGDVTLSVAAGGFVPQATQIIAGPGLAGGGPLTGNVTLSVLPGTFALQATQVIAGTGLTGGGPLSANVTLALAAGAAVPPTTQIIAGPGLSGGGPLTGNVTLAVVDNSNIQKLQLALAGALKATRHQLNFIAGSGVNLNLVDDAANDEGTLTITAVSTGAPGPSIFSVNGTQIGTQVELNLIASTNVTLAGVNNTGAGRVDITVSATGGGGSQTPWTSDIDGGGHTLFSVANLYVNSSVQVGLNANDSSSLLPTGLLINSPGVSPRWYLLKSGTETGGNAGSDLYYARFSDSGVSLGNPFWIVRSTGMVNCGNGLTVTGGNVAVGTAPLANYAYTCVTDTTYTGGFVVVANNMNGGAGYSFHGIETAATGQAGFILQNDLGHQLVFIYGGSNHSNAFFRDNGVAMFPNDFVFFTNTNGEAVRIKQSGNIGIGQANPQSKLSVSGNVGLYSPGSASAGSPVAASLYLGDGNYAGSVSYYNSAPGLSAVFNPSQGITGDLAFYVYSGLINARSEVMRVVYTPGTIGRVGIMNTAPAYTLDVTGTGHFTGQVNIDQDVVTPWSFRAGGDVFCGTLHCTGIDSGGTTIQLLNASFVVGKGLYIANQSPSNATYNAWEFWGSGDLLTFGPSANANWPLSLNINTAGATRLRVDKNGSIGVGVLTPNAAYKLDVAGDCNITGTYRVNGVPLSTGGSQTPWTSDINAAGFKLFSTGNIGIGNTAAVPPDTGGNPTLLVGSTTASVLGEVVACGNQPTIGGLCGSLAYANYNIAGSDKRIAAINVATDTALNGGCLMFYTWAAGTAGERMRITAAGNVGISTGTPGGTLDIADGKASDTPGSGQKLRLSTGGTGLFGFRMDGSNNYLVMDSNWSSWFPTMCWNRAQGYVGIMKATASYALDVSGDVNASGLHRAGGLPIPRISTYTNAARPLGIVVQNNNGVPIFVSVIVAVAVGQYAQLLTDAGNPPSAVTCAQSNPGGAIANFTVSGWVMPSHYYWVSAPSGTLVKWYEWT